MTPTDLGFTSAVLMQAVTDMFSTMAPFLLVIILVIAVVLGVRWGFKLFRNASKGKTA